MGGEPRKRAQPGGERRAGPGPTPRPSCPGGGSRADRSAALRRTEQKRKAALRGGREGASRSAGQPLRPTHTPSSAGPAGGSPARVSDTPAPRPPRGAHGPASSRVTYLGPAGWAVATPGRCCPIPGSGRPEDRWEDERVIRPRAGHTPSSWPGAPSHHAGLALTLRCSPAPYWQWPGPQCHPSRRSEKSPTSQGCWGGFRSP